LDIVIEAAGWIGAGLILLSYILISAGRLSGDSAAYQLLNIGGAFGIFVNSWWHGAVPSGVLNLIWLTIGIVATVRIWRRRAMA
jgi:hypothetical protein